MNSKLISLSLIAGFALFSFLCVQVNAYEINENALSYASASSLKREISSMNSQIKRNDRKINSIKSLSSLSDYDKKRKIRRLQNENYYLKRKVTKIKNEYKRAIS